MTFVLNLANAIHKARHATGGPDALTPADIGAATSAAVATAQSATVINASNLIAEANIARAAESANAANIAKAVPRWAPATAYTMGQQVVSPTNDIVSRTTAGTSGAAYDATNWTQSSTYARPVDAARALVTKLDQKQAAVVMVVLGDSTSTPPTTGAWVDDLAVSMGAKWPSCSVQKRLYNSGSSNYPSPTIVTTGAITPPGLVDTFTRTAADLNGSSPDVGGGAWVSSAGMFSLNGSAAVHVNGVGGVSAKCPVSGVGRMNTTSVFSIHAGGAYNTGRFHLISSWVDGANFLWAELVQGTKTINFNKSTTVGGTVTVGTSTYAAAGIVDGGPENVTLSIAHSGLNVTYTVGTATFTYTLTSGDSTAFAAASRVGFYLDPNDCYVDSITATLEAASAATTLDIYNGSVGSTGTSYPLTRIAAMIPVAPDVLFINYGHNNITDTPSQFAANLDTLIAAIRAVYAAVPIVIVGQNPQVLPSTGVAAHLLREQSKRAYAIAGGYGYLPAFEAFQKQSYPGNFIQSDGVHPTTSGVNDGGALWSVAALACIVGSATTTSDPSTSLLTNAAADAASKVATQHTTDNGQYANKVDVQAFTASGTWTKPAGAQRVSVLLIGPGSGGGAGARNASGTAISGGAGGGGGAVNRFDLDASLLGSTVAVTIPTGGVGAPGQTVDTTAGADGGIPSGSTVFGVLAASRMLAGGGGGKTATSVAGIAGTGHIPGGPGSACAVGAAGVGTAQPAGPPGGGAGGGISTTPAHFAGGAGLGSTTWLGSTATAGSAGGGVGANGAASTLGLVGSAGAGGGANISGAGGTGGNGGTYGAGGGGGGASLNGSVSGAGGNGAGGLCIVTTYF